MRIALVCPYNIYRMGGVQEAVLAHQAELMKRGHEVYIIAPNSKNGLIEKKPNIITVGRSAELNTPFNTMVDVAMVTTDRKQLDELLDNYNFDIVHVHEPWIPLLGFQVLARSNAKNVATFHARLPDSVFTNSFEKLITPYQKAALKNLKAITVVSDESARLVKRVNFLDLPLHKIPNGVDLASYDPNTIEAESIYPDKKVILFVGRLEKRKGAKLLIKAFEELQKKRDDVKLLIAGKGKRSTILKDYVRKKSIKNIDFLGYVSDERKKGLLKRADLYCSPAMYGESFGIVLLEAMAMGTVTVAGDNPGYRCVLKGQGRDSLVDAFKPEILSSKLNAYLDDEKLRKSWIDWAEKEVRQYNYPTVVNKLEKLYEDLLGNE